jgi:hypothetical protein
MLALVCGNVGHGREDIRRMCRASFYAVPVVDAALSRLRIHVEELQVVVEID